MSMLSVATDQQRADRLRDLQAVARDREASADADKRNEGFVQVYPKGWARLQALIRTNPSAARVYAFLAEHIDGAAGAVVVSQEVMAAELGIHERTVRRLTTSLEQAGALVRLKVGTGVYAYCLDPDEVWRSWDNAKDVAAFRTKTLVRKSDKANAQVRRKLKLMLGQPELPLD